MFLAFVKKAPFQLRHIEVEPSAHVEWIQLTYRLSFVIASKRERHCKTMRLCLFCSV